MNFFDNKEQKLKHEVSYLYWREYILDPFVNNCECHRCSADKMRWKWIKLIGYLPQKNDWHDSNEVGVSSVRKNLGRGLFFIISGMMVVSLILLIRFHTGLMFLNKSKTIQDNFIYCVILIIILLALMGKCQTINGVGSIKLGRIVNEWTLEWSLL